jgi:hypothetical protein
MAWVYAPAGGWDTIERVALVAPATFPNVALLAPTAEAETVARVTDGVVTKGTKGAAYTPYAGTQLLAVPPTTVACAAANPDSNKIIHKVFSKRIGSSTDLSIEMPRIEMPRIEMPRIEMPRNFFRRRPIAFRREHHNPKTGSGSGFY